MPEPTCPKCGAKSVASEWMPGILRRICNTCHYSWLEKAPSDEEDASDA